MDMGPIYSAEHRAVRSSPGSTRASSEGAELVVDGRPFRHPEHPDGFFLGVTLFDHVTPAMAIYQEEIFGPVLGIVRVATYDEALALINGHRVRERHGHLHDRWRRRAALQAGGGRAR